MLHWPASTSADSYPITVFHCPLPNNNRKMESQLAPRDLRSVSSVLWRRCLNCLLIYNYRVLCVFRLLWECVRVHVWARAHTCGFESLVSDFNLSLRNVQRDVSDMRSSWKSHLQRCSQARDHCLWQQRNSPDHLHIVLSLSVSSLDCQLCTLNAKWSVLRQQVNHLKPPPLSQKNPQKLKCII